MKPGDANAYALSIGNDPATLRAELRQARRWWRGYRAAHPREARRIARMSEAELASLEIELLETQLRLHPDDTSAAYALRLYRERAIWQAQPKRKIRRRQSRHNPPTAKPTAEPQTAPPMPLPAWALPAQPLGSKSESRPAPGPAVGRGCAMAFGTRAHARRWHGLNDW